MTSQTLSGKPLTILVVDDDSDCVEMMSLLLESYGHKAAGAVNGEEAIRVARRLRPDIVLLDIGLPGMNGLEICRRLRQERSKGDPCIVGMSGWAGAERREAAMNAGFDEYLVKPAEAEVVLSALEACRSQLELARA